MQQLDVSATWKDDSTRVVAKAAVLLAFLLWSVLAGAQGILPEEPAPELPVTAEILFGVDRTDLKVVVVRRFASQSRANILSVTSAQGEPNSTNGLDFVNVSYIGYDLYKGLGVNVGLAIDRSVGLNPTLGLQYAKQKGPFTLIWDPAFFPRSTHDLQNFAQVEFRPHIARNWRLYENVQFFDDYNPTAGRDERRFVHMRTNAQYKKFGFGFGGDLDWYGEPTNFRTNYGPVLSYSF